MVTTFIDFNSINSFYISNQKLQISDKHTEITYRGQSVEAGLMTKSYCQWERDCL